MCSCDVSIAQLVGRWSAVFFHRLAVTGLNPLQMINFGFFFKFLLRMNSGWVYRLPRQHRSFLAISFVYEQKQDF